MWCVATGLYVVFLDADWYRYLMIFKDFRGADSAEFWQNYQGLKLIKFLSKSLDITILAETDLFSMYQRLADIWFSYKKPNFYVSPNLIQIDVSSKLLSGFA